MKCPTCNSNLILRQINLNTAVYLCEIRTCSYPEGHGWIFVARSFDNILNQNIQAPDIFQETEKDTTDNMEWLDNICDKGINLESNGDTAQSDQLSAIYNEILKELDSSNSNLKSNAEKQVETVASNEFDMPLLNLF